MLGLSFVTVALAAALGAVASPTVKTVNARSSSSLESLSLQKVLKEAAPVFGDYTNSKNKTAQWMKHYPDSTLLVHMNIPGAHDPQTCKSEFCV
jgi:1-phosphatidylinositol phosphodiesterase